MTVSPTARRGSGLRLRGRPGAAAAVLPSPPFCCTHPLPSVGVSKAFPIRPKRGVQQNDRLAAAGMFRRSQRPPPLPWRRTGWRALSQSSGATPPSSAWRTTSAARLRRRRDCHSADNPSLIRIETPAKRRGGCSRMVDRTLLSVLRRPLEGEGGAAE